MYKVSFSEVGSDCLQTMFQSPKDNEALEFALAVHRSSNVPHRVFVVDPNGERILTCWFDPEQK